ncbi:MAG TPA: MASE3 domain-containing protein [Dissulfurispiraceae bacterium]
MPISHDAIAGPSSLFPVMLVWTTEVLSVLVAWGISMLAWNTRKVLPNDYLLLLGISFLFVGGLDLIHAFVFGLSKGEESGINLMTQAWLAARYVQVFSFFIAPLFLKWKVEVRYVFSAYAAAFVLMVLSLFRWNNFPVCYIEGAGNTLFKTTSEYLIILFFLFSIFTLLGKRRMLDKDVLQFITLSILMLAASEFSFTLFAGIYDPGDLAGHFFKIAGFYLVYLAVIKTGLIDPYRILLRGFMLGKEESAQKELELAAEMEARAHIENAARECKHQQRALMDSIPDVVWLKDRQGRFIAVNEAFSKTLGMRPEEIIGKTFFDVWPRGVAEEYMADALEVMRSGKRKQREGVLIHKEGKARRVEVITAPIRNEHGEVTGIACIARDCVI